MNKPRIPPDAMPLMGPMVDGFCVAEWCPTDDGSGHPTAVAIVFNLRNVGDVVLRLKSRRAVEEVISALRERLDRVFPPVA